jgi:hypothetical protein
MCGKPEGRNRNSNGQQERRGEERSYSSLQILAAFVVQG